MFETDEIVGSTRELILYGRLVMPYPDVDSGNAAYLLKEAKITFTVVTLVSAEFLELQIEPKNPDVLVRHIAQGDSAGQFSLNREDFTVELIFIEVPEPCSVEPFYE